MVSTRPAGFLAHSRWISLGGRPGLALGLAAALVACGDDGGSVSTAGNDSTGAGTTQSADDGPSPGTTTGPSGGTGSTGSTGDDTEGTAADGSTAGSTGGSGTDDTGGATSEGTDTGEASSSSSGGTTGLPECEMCEDDEVCVAYQAQQTMYECHPIPKECAGDVDCECGGSLCEDPYVGCSDPAEPNTLFCACIAC